MSDFGIAGRFQLLKPDTRNLNTAGKRNHPYDPFGVDQNRALWTRIFTQVHIGMCASVWSVRVAQQATNLKFL